MNSRSAPSIFLLLRILSAFGQHKPQGFCLYFFTIPLFWFFTWASFSSEIYISPVLRGFLFLEG